MSSLSSDMVRIYLQEIGQYPLLKPEEEIAFKLWARERSAFQSSSDWPTAKPQPRAHSSNPGQSYKYSPPSSK